MRAEARSDRGKAHSRAGRPPSSRSFGLKFVGLLIVFGLFQLTLSNLIEPLQVFFARLLSGSLVALGWPVERQGVLVAFPGGTFAVGPECTALAYIGVLVAFAVAFPATWGERAMGILLGAAMMLSLNLVRLVTCAFVLRFAPAAFPMIHEYVWQVGLAGLLMGLVLLWVRRVRAALR
jgi:exosortase/archaeosortase family protein